MIKECEVCDSLFETGNGKRSHKALTCSEECQKIRKYEETNKWHKENREKVLEYRDIHRDKHNKHQRDRSLIRTNIITEKLGNVCFFNNGDCSNSINAHRKDGKKHKKFHGITDKAFSEIDWSKYIHLCYRHHRAIHEIMSLLNLTWGEIVNIYKR